MIYPPENYINQLIEWWFFLLEECTQFEIYVQDKSSRAITNPMQSIICMKHVLFCGDAIYQYVFLFVLGLFNWELKKCVPVKKKRKKNIIDYIGVKTKKFINGPGFDNLTKLNGTFANRKPLLGKVIWFLLFCQTHLFTFLKKMFFFFD